MQEKTVLTYAKFNPGNIVLYPSYELFNLYRGHNENSRENLKNNMVKGVLSNASAKKLTNLVYGWLFCIDYKLDDLRHSKSNRDKYISFITLTLPSKQFHTDYELKRMGLNAFLITLERKFNISVFLWKAESQENRNIHFHILVNGFIPWQEVRSIWNGILDKLGYIDLFQKKHGHRNPNSTDIHGLYKDKTGKNIGNIGAYLAKYMSKNEGLKRGIDGRIWGCSDNLKKVEFFKILVDGNWDWRNFLQELNRKKNIRKYEQEYFLLLSGEYKTLLKKSFPILYGQIKKHYVNEFNKLYRVDS